MQDAHKTAGRTCIQDADKQRPYYGRGFSAWVRFPRKSHACPVRWPGGWTWPDANAHPSSPGRQIRVEFTRNISKHHQSPSIVGTLLVRVLRAVRPKCGLCRPTCVLRAMPLNMHIFCLSILGNARFPCVLCKHHTQHFATLTQPDIMRERSAMVGCFDMHAGTLGSVRGNIESLARVRR